MKIFLSSLLILIISNNSFACVEDKVEIDKKTFNVCRVEKYGFLSKDCKDVQSCFPVKGLEVTLVPTQNPAATLCMMIKGEPASGIPKSLGSVESFCTLNGKVVDLNQLMKARH